MLVQQNGTSGSDSALPDSPCRKPNHLSLQKVFHAPVVSSHTTPCGTNDNVADEPDGTGVA